METSERTGEGGRKMASVNWMKMTGQKASSMSKHMDKDERAEHEHANKDIQRDLTEQNYTIGCSSWKEAVAKNKERVAAVDAVQPPKRVKKDRVTAVSLEVPCPKEIEQAGRAREFFEKVFEKMQQYFGKANVQGGVVHVDEVHTYTDRAADGSLYKRESLQHMHTLITPYTREKGVNGKAFETRERLKGFNNGIDKMVREEFGIAFNTGELAKHKTVEQLKTEGALLEAQQELEATIAKGKDATRRLSKIQKAIDGIQESTEFNSMFAKMTVNEAQKQLKAAGQEKLLDTILKTAWQQTNEALGIEPEIDEKDGGDGFDLGD